MRLMEKDRLQLYGGIHFRDSIENGMDQGRRIGRYFIQKLRIQ